MYAKNVTELIGNTPLVKINSLSDEFNAQILGKCEFLNPAHSVKDRIAKNMIETAIKENKINPNTTIIEPTSGNTGIGLAMVCAALKLKLILTMPESMSIERRKLLKALGANLVLTPANLGMSGAVQKADELQSQTANSILIGQFQNPANPQMHYQTTAVEIYEATKGKIDFFVAAIGTGGTISGVGKYLKEKIPNIKIIAIEPDTSAILSGKAPGAHKIQGIGAGFIPKALNTKIYDEILQISSDEAIKTARDLAKNDGLLVGISSGANAKATSIIAQKNPKKTIVTILCDTGERYLSTELYE